MAKRPKAIHAGLFVAELSLPFLNILMAHLALRKIPKNNHIAGSNFLPNDLPNTKSQA